MIRSGGGGSIGSTYGTQLRAATERAAAGSPQRGSALVPDGQRAASADDRIPGPTKEAVMADHTCTHDDHEHGTGARPDCCATEHEDSVERPPGHGCCGGANRPDGRPAT
jgi:hypothetical protein